MCFFGIFRVGPWGTQDGKVPWITTEIGNLEARGGPHTQQDSTSLLPYTSQPDGPLRGPADTYGSIYMIFYKYIYLTGARDGWAAAARPGPM